MEAIILSGGFGTRLKSVVPDLPKPLAPVAGRPFLEILLQLLAHKGFNRIILSVGFMADKIIQHFGDRFEGIELEYEVETSPLGTGGAVQQALKKCVTDHVVILNGDTFLDLDYSGLENFWRENHNPLIVGREVLDSSRYGLIQTDGSRVLSFSTHGHHGPGLVNAGCYLFPKFIFNNFQPDKAAFSLEADWLPKSILSQRFDLFITNGLFIDIGIPEDYTRAQKLLEGVD